MKRYIISTLLALLICVPFLSFGTVAADELPETSDEIEADSFGQSTGQEETSEIADNTDVLGTPYDWPDWLGEEPIDPNIVLNDEKNVEIITYPESYETAGELARIEYHLSIISGGVILAVCILWFWLTVYKPLKMFVDF